MKNVAIVAPCHIQPSEAWVSALEKQRAFADVIIVDDSDGEIALPDDWEVYGYKRQEKELGKELYGLFKRFHKSAACKQFGLWLAYKQCYEYVIVVDSDCIVPDSFVEFHTRMMQGTSTAAGGWANPLSGTGFYSRGYPYSKRNWKIGAHMGLWTNELDLYGTDRIGNIHIPKQPDTEYFSKYINCRPFFPLSGMNVCFRREVIPYMLFLPNFESDKGEKFTRHDDIWGGYIFQKIMQKKHYALSFGQPFVYHDTVVVPEEDAEAEKAMIKYEDDFFYFIDSMLDLRPYIGNATASEVFDHLGHANAPGHFADLLDAFVFQSKAYANI